MKYCLYTIYFVCSLLLVGLFSSCEADNVGTEYGKIEGITFASSTLNSVTIQPSDWTFAVEIYRADVSDALSGSLTIAPATVIRDKRIQINEKDTLVKDTVPLNCTITGYSFAAGETMAMSTVTVEGLKIGEESVITLSIPEELISPTGIGETTVRVRMDYLWEVLGTGKYTDAFVYSDDNGFVWYDVEIQKANGYERYRVMAPYVEMLKDVAKTEDKSWVGNTSAPYVEFWTTTGDLVEFAPFNTGLIYDGNPNAPIVAMHASYFVGLSPEYSKWVMDGVAHLAPLYYIESLQAGFNHTGTLGLIYIALPGIDIE
ncbi:MAG: hypothetical protein LBH58_02830 [Tannerellaceae bacterium]|jgi:hypothetical protein|nr:hypothetical protein [Tannerellaceae bacterium]